MHSLVGEHGVVRGDGLVFVNGELWQRAPRRRRGARARRRRRVEGVVEDGLELIVAPAPAAASAPRTRAHRIEP